MEIYTLLDTLKDMLENSKNVPFSQKCIVNKDDALDIIDEIIAKMPDELKQAKWVKEERQRIMADAEAEAQTLIKNAEAKIVKMIDDNVITKQALAQKEEIIENANKISKEISVGTRDYADEVLGKLEEFLEHTMEVVRQNRMELK